ncbi:MAG: hypothetical protein HQL51_12025 [Magnetococcales bacterium]|nr:hypothetical protein [Magnetococcales bacterium]
MSELNPPGNPSAPELNPLQQDVLVELFNMSLGQAVSTLSDLVGEEVFVSLPEFRVVERARMTEVIAEGLGAGVDMVAMPCRLLFAGQGAVAGLALLAAPRESFRHLADLLWNHQSPPAGERERMEQEAMLEVGDLLLYTCASNMSQFLESEIEGRAAVHVENAASMLRDLAPAWSPPGEPSLAELRVRFHLPDRDEVQGLMLFVLELSALPLLRRELNRLLGKLGV